MLWVLEKSKVIFHQEKFNVLQLYTLLKLNNLHMTKKESYETPKISRDEVLTALKSCSAGLEDPANIDLETPTGRAAWDLYEAWQEQLDNEAVELSAEWTKNNIDKNMIMVDAGFHGKSYLESILDWIDLDRENVEQNEEIDEAVKAETLAYIDGVVTRVQGLL